jgi:hypothetical protein
VPARGKNDPILRVFAVVFLQGALACSPTPFVPFRGGNDAGAVSTPDAMSAPPASADSGSSSMPPAPTPDAPVMPAPKPDAAMPVNPGVACGMAMPWTADSDYKEGAQVTHGTPPHIYQCRPFPNSGWCPMSAYEPGKDGAPWMDAWMDAGPCP